MSRGVGSTSAWPDPNRGASSHETVNVFIGAEAANRELGERLSPRSSVVLSSDGTPDYTCGDSTQSIYNATQPGTVFKFRVDDSRQ